MVLVTMEQVAGNIILIQETACAQQHELILITLLGCTYELLFGSLAGAAE